MLRLSLFRKMHVIVKKGDLSHGRIGRKRDGPVQAAVLGLCANLCEQLFVVWGVRVRQLVHCSFKADVKGYLLATAPAVQLFLPASPSRHGCTVLT